MMPFRSDNIWVLLLTADCSVHDWCCTRVYWYWS